MDQLEAQLAQLPEFEGFQLYMVTPAPPTPVEQAPEPEPMPTPAKDSIFDYRVQPPGKGVLPPAQWLEIIWLGKHGVLFPPAPLDGPHTRPAPPFPTLPDNLAGPDDDREHFARLVLSQDLE
jgi:hypothetical protein